MTYYTGCDAHSKTCTLQHMDEEGALGLTMTVPTDKDSLYKFLDELDEPTIMTLEAGRNWWHLYNLFEVHPKVSLVNVVDPRRSRNLAKELSVQSGYGRASNDRIDGEMLAEQTRRGIVPKIHIPTPKQMKLRTLNRYRTDSVIIRTATKNKIHALFAMHGTKAKIDDLLEDTKIFDKINHSVPDYISFLIQQLLKRVVLLNEQITMCDNKLHTVLPESHPQIALLSTHPGLGPIFTRTIYTEILDIGYFKEHKYLNSYAGLAPIQLESDGRRKGGIHLNPHCNYYLKYAFVEAAHTVRNYPKFRRKYDLDVRKHGKIIAKLNLARKICKAVYWMLTRQQPYKE